MEKVKIVLDADVLIHFSKAECLSFLPKIFPEYSYTILSAVYEEVGTIQKQIDNQITFMKNMTIIPFNPTNEMKIEYAKLRSRYGKGESACMAYCKFTKNVIGSSNLRDIKTYCTEQQITYLTTLDFLYYAYSRGKMSKDQCEYFMKEVNAKGSKLPLIDITTYIPNAVL